MRCTPPRSVPGASPAAFRASRCACQPERHALGLLAFGGRAGDPAGKALLRSACRTLRALPLLREFQPFSARCCFLTCLAMRQIVSDDIRRNPVASAWATRDEARQEWAANLWLVARVGAVTQCSCGVLFRPRRFYSPRSSRGAQVLQVLQAAARNAVSSIAAGAHALVMPLRATVQHGCKGPSGSAGPCIRLSVWLARGPRLATRALRVPVPVQPLAAARATPRRERVRRPKGAGVCGGDLAQPRRSSRSA